MWSRDDATMAESAWKIDVEASASSDLRPGTRVTVVGLSSRPELNGRTAHIVKALASETGRYGVRVERLGKPLAMRPENIRVRHITRVHVFVASHVASPARLAALRHCLRSVLRQTSYAMVHLSWSAESAELAGGVQEMLTQLFEQKHERAMHFHQPAALSQFEHLAFLTKHLEEMSEEVRRNVGIPSPWVLLSTDDGIWHPKRMETYTRLLEDLSDERRAATSAIVCPWHVLRARGDGGEPTPIASAKEVNGLLASGRAWVSRTGPARGGDEGDDAVGEFWSACVRLERLRSFFSVSEPGLVASPGCDLAFARFLFASGPGREAELTSCYVDYEPGGPGGTPPPSPWLFAHNAHPRAAASS